VLTTNKAKALERRILEKSWGISLQEKEEQKLRDAHHNKDMGLLLHEQCEKYKRYVHKTLNATSTPQGILLAMPPQPEADIGNKYSQANRNP
jgi:hypothetical protein